MHACVEATITTNSNKTKMSSNRKTNIQLSILILLRG